jgi:uncharacterized membrane protein
MIMKAIGLVLILLGIILMMTGIVLDMVVRAGAVGKGGRYSRREELRLTSTRRGVRSVLVFTTGIILVIAGLVFLDTSG